LGNVPDPSTNLLNLRAAFQRPSYDMALFVNNALDSRPTILRTYDSSPRPASACHELQTAHRGIECQLAALNDCGHQTDSSVLAVWLASGD